MAELVDPFLAGLLHWHPATNREVTGTAFLHVHQERHGRSVSAAAGRQEDSSRQEADSISDIEDGWIREDCHDDFADCSPGGIESVLTVRILRIGVLSLTHGAHRSRIAGDSQRPKSFLGGKIDVEKSLGRSLVCNHLTAADFLRGDNLAQKVPAAI